MLGGEACGDGGGNGGSRWDGSSLYITIYYERVVSATLYYTLCDVNGDPGSRMQSE